MHLRVLVFILLGLIATPAFAQLVGTDTAPGDSCSAFPAGATRMTADADQDGKEITLICDGTTWESAGGTGLPVCNVDEYIIMSSSGWSCYTGFPPGGTDSTPDAFTFTDITDAEPSTLTTSEIIQITGIDTQATVTISGDGTPEFRVCADVACSSVITDWRSGFDTIEFGRYLQLRANAPSSYSSSNNTINLGVGTSSDQWTIATRHRLVFITSVAYSANLGGVSGADSKCNTRASAGGLPGTYYAWISGQSSSNEPAQRFVKTLTPYALPNGSLIANDWTDLTDNNIINPINVDEYGGPQSRHAWTNTSATGFIIDTSSSDTCSGFTSAGGSYTTKGDSSATNAGWSDASSVAWCGSGQFALYCFEQ